MATFGSEAAASFFSSFSRSMFANSSSFHVIFVVFVVFFCSSASLRAARGTYPSTADAARRASAALNGAAGGFSSALVVIVLLSLISTTSRSSTSSFTALRANRADGFAAAPSFALIARPLFPNRFANASAASTCSLQQNARTNAPSRTTRADPSTSYRVPPVAVPLASRHGNHAHRPILPRSAHASLYSLSVNANLDISSYPSPAASLAPFLANARSTYANLRPSIRVPVPVSRPVVSRLSPSSSESESDDDDDDPSSPYTSARVPADMRSDDDERRALERDGTRPTDGMGWDGSTAHP